MKAKKITVTKTKRVTRWKCPKCSKLHHTEWLANGCCYLKQFKGKAATPGNQSEPKGKGEIMCKHCSGYGQVDYGGFICSDIGACEKCFGTGLALPSSK